MTFVLLIAILIIGTFKITMYNIKKDNIVIPRGVTENTFIPLDNSKEGVYVFDTQTTKKRGVTD